MSAPREDVGPRFYGATILFTADLTAEEIAPVLAALAKPRLVVAVKALEVVEVSPSQELEPDTEPRTLTYAEVAERQEQP